MQEQIKHYEDKLAYEIDSWDLNEVIRSGKQVVVIDARSADAYAKGHIPNAVSIPHRNMNEQTTAFIGKESLVVVYCDGIGCNASTKGALNMAKLGFKTKELIGGLDWWKRDGYEVKSGNFDMGQR
jgi:rhodanese-related sulfurtransferase